MDAESSVPTMIDRGMVAEYLKVPGQMDNKYSRGCVLLATGSPTYPGAALLGVLGAARAGVGLLRYLGPERCENLILPVVPEAVLGAGRFDCAVIGSGWDSTMASVAEQLARECALQEKPLVVDAGALPGAREWAGKGGRLVVTPHAGEAVQLIQQLGITGSFGDVAGEGGEGDSLRAVVEANVADVAVLLARELGAVVVLKAAQTAVAAPSGQVWQFQAPSGWGATAGAGDVLAGVIGALVAAAGPQQLMGDVAAVCAAVAVHGWAAGIAAGVTSNSLRETGSPGRPIVASQIAAAVPSVIEEVLTRAG